jgi:hypothetical protein
MLACIMLISYLSQFLQSLIKGRNMNIHWTEKKAGGGVDEFKKAPLKQVENVPNEPDSKAGFLRGLGGGTMLQFNMQPYVESVRHWGLND